ncbi:hypothetical protein ABBQ32_013818 [Trebouxia sp. C0010 RCD-2024]
MRGLEHCSTSYASRTCVTAPSFDWQRCLARKPATQRLRVVAAEAKDAQLVQTSRGGQIPSPSNAFFPQKVSLREAQNGEWVDKVDDWAAFWEDDYITYEGADLDDTHDALQTYRSKARTELMDKAEDAIMSEMMTSKWRDDHPEAVYFQPPPLHKQYEADVPEPEPLPVRDWNDFELRAFVEKRHWQAREDAVWTQRKQDIGRYSVVNVTSENDIRLMPKWEPIKEWTHEEIWDLILNGGQNANPDDVPMKVFDPLTKSDYFAEGIK